VLKKEMKETFLNPLNNLKEKTSWIMTLKNNIIPGMVKPAQLTFTLLGSNRSYTHSVSF
jgi:hypothetical protein